MERIGSLLHAPKDTAVHLGGQLLQRLKSNMIVGLRYLGLVGPMGFRDYSLVLSREWGVDPYSSPYIITKNSLPAFPTKNQTD